MLLTSSPALRPPANAVPTSYREALPIAFPMDYRKEDIGWSPTGRRNILARELPEVQHDRMIALSFLAWRINPMAKRLVDMQVNFVLGNGISVSSRDKEVLMLIGDWWNDPYNQWPMRIQQRLRDLYIYGEWLHRPLISDDGFVWIRDIQPDVISAAFPDPMDHGVVDRIVYKNIILPNGSLEQNTYSSNLIRRRLNEIERKLDDKYTGDVFLFGINRTSDSMRGIGELYPLLDYIDMYDDILFSRAEKIRNSAHVYYDLQLEGMTETEMRNYLMNETNLPPRPGTVYAHNAQAVLEMKAPDLKADDHAQDTSVLKSHIVSSAGWPGTWFDDPGTAGRAVGAEMAEPALKGITNLQAYVEQIIRYEINFMLHQKRDAGEISFTGDKIPPYQIAFTRPSTRDIQKTGPALARLGQFLDSVTNKELSAQEARYIIVSQINQLGLSDAEFDMELPTELEALTDPKRILQQQQDAQRAALANKTAETTTGKKVAASSPSSASTSAKTAEDAPISLPRTLSLFRGS